jgi:hypothetical protein
VTSLDAFFESYYRLRPVNATFTGVHRHDDRLPDWSPDGLAASLDEMRALRASLAGSPPRDGASLGDVHVRDQALADACLEVDIAERESGHFHRGNPSLVTGEALFSVIGLMTRPFAPAAVRVDSAVARLSAIPAFLAGARRAIRAGVPDEWRRKALREIDGADRLCRDSVARWIADEPVEDSARGRLLDAARRAGHAFEEFRGWLIRDVAPADPARCGCGSDLFDLLLARGHWCARSRSTLAAEARAAFDEALARLDEQARSVAPGGWPEIQSRLADTHPSVGGYLSAYQRIWDACRARAEACDLLTWPSSPIRYVPMPRCTREAAPFLYYLFYRSPAPFDDLPVHDYVVPPIELDMPTDEQRRRLRATNTSVIKLNHVVHHGAIGHHVQNSYAYAGESAIGRVAAVDCASRIGMFAGGTMAEGWACYATDLMDEVGFLTPEESVAQQHTRARLVARAVVDIGLHEGSLTFDAAAAIYRDRIGMTRAASRAEACKNSMFPGTAVMYWLGTEGLHQLRAARERAEGTAFSLRRFHERVLGFGSIPVPLIAQLLS